MRLRIFLILFLSGLSFVAYNQTRSLDFYLQEGIRNSPLLNDYRNQINSAIEDSLLIRASRKPFIDAKSQLLYSPAYRNFGYDEAITDGGNYSAVMGVSQNIFNKKEITNQLKAVDIQKQLISNSSKISLTELNKIITDQFLNSYSAYNDFLFNKTFLNLFEEENEIVSQFVRNGVCKQTDYLALLIESQSQKILVNQLNSQYRKEIRLLNQLCGLNDSTITELAEPQLKIKGAPEITRSPSYMQYKIDSIRIDNEKSAIDLRYKPKVNWFADAGILTRDPWNFYRYIGYSAGISLNMIIYDGKQRGIEKRKLDFNEYSRKSYEDNFQKQYSQQVRQLTEELKSLNEMSEQLQSQLVTSDKLVKALKNQLEEGLIQMTEYINALKNFRTISRTLSLTDIYKLKVINEINFFITE
jgi:outer membrane protein TolC